MNRLIVHASTCNIWIKRSKEVEEKERDLCCCFECLSFRLCFIWNVSVDFGCHTIESCLSKLWNKQNESNINECPSLLLVFVLIDLAVIVWVHLSFVFFIVGTLNTFCEFPKEKREKKLNSDFPLMEGTATECLPMVGSAPFGVVSTGTRSSVANLSSSTCSNN